MLPTIQASSKEADEMAEKTRDEYILNQKKAEIQSSTIRVINQKKADQAMDVSDWWALNDLSAYNYTTTLYYFAERTEWAGQRNGGKETINHQR